MNLNTKDVTGLIYVIFKFSLAFFCLLHALFVLYAVRQIINTENLLSTLKRYPHIIIGSVHAIILLVLLVYICILPQ